MGRTFIIGQGQDGNFAVMAITAYEKEPLSALQRAFSDKARGHIGDVSASGVPVTAEPGAVWGPTFE